MTVWQLRQWLVVKPTSTIPPTLIILSLGMVHYSSVLNVFKFSDSPTTAPSTELISHQRVNQFWWHKNTCWTQILIYFSMVASECANFPSKTHCGSSSGIKYKMQQREKKCQAADETTTSCGKVTWMWRKIKRATFATLISRRSDNKSRSILTLMPATVCDNYFIF